MLKKSSLLTLIIVLTTALNVAAMKNEPYSFRGITFGGPASQLFDNHQVVQVAQSSEDILDQTIIYKALDEKLTLGAGKLKEVHYGVWNNSIYLARLHFDATSHDNSGKILNACIKQWGEPDKLIKDHSKYLLVLIWKGPTVRVEYLIGHSRSAVINLKHQPSLKGIKALREQKKNGRSSSSDF